MSTAGAEVWLPLGFATWHPAAQGVSLALLTLITEDAVAVGAALLGAGGVLGWTTAFLGSFLGIWFGDAVLYAVARVWGRPLLTRPWFQRLVDSGRVEAGERWFHRKGARVLLLSRVLPGTRLPTYLAAGLLRMPFSRFLVITGVGAAAWTGGIFIVAALLGAAIWPWLRRWQALALWLPLAILVACVLPCLLRGINRGRLRFRLRALLDRWRRWEFWPPWLFYAPVALYGAWLACRFRGLTLPAAANPGMHHGGLIGESKFATLEELMATSQEFTAPAWLIAATEPAERKRHLDELLGGCQLEFPLVLKPDIGQRGIGVKLIRSRAAAENYLTQTRVPLVVQCYAPGPHEVGVFYVRRPGEPTGRIFAMTEKLFPCLSGDGVHSVEELIWQDSRARCMAGRYLERFNARRHEILAPGQTLKLVEAGNHAQGCVFRDGMHLWSSELEGRIDQISRRLRGFFIGRYDIRYASLETLQAGTGFKIIELNGAAAEATNIYDAQNSLFAAYRTLFRQWRLVFEIGAANRAGGTKPASLAALWRSWRSALQQFDASPIAD